LATNQLAAGADLLAPPIAFDAAGQILCETDDGQCYNQGANSNINASGAGRGDSSGGAGGSITQGVLAAVVVISTVLVLGGLIVLTCCSSMARRNRLLQSVTACICPYFSLTKQNPSVRRRRQPRLLPKDDLQFHDDLVASKLLDAAAQYNLSSNVAAGQHEFLHGKTQNDDGQILVTGNGMPENVEQKHQGVRMCPQQNDMGGEAASARQLPINARPLPEPFWTVQHITWPSFATDSAYATTSSPRPSSSTLEVPSAGNNISGIKSARATVRMSSPHAIYLVEQAATNAAAATSAAANSTTFNFGHPLQQGPTAFNIQGPAAVNSVVARASEFVQPLAGDAAAGRSREFSPIPGKKRERLRTPLESLLAKAPLARNRFPSGSPVAVTRTAMSVELRSPMAAQAVERFSVDAAHSSRKKTACTINRSTIEATTTQHHGGGTMRLVKGPNIASQYAARLYADGSVLLAADACSNRKCRGDSGECGSIVADLVLLNKSLPESRNPTGGISDDLVAGAGL
jgi:hypothetical protein